MPYKPNFNCSRTVKISHCWLSIYIQIYIINVYAPVTKSDHHDNAKNERVSASPRVDYLGAPSQETRRQSLYCRWWSKDNPRKTSESWRKYLCWSVLRSYTGYTTWLLGITVTHREIYRSTHIMTAGGMAQLKLYQGPMIPMEVNPLGSRGAAIDHWVAVYCSLW